MDLIAQRKVLPILKEIERMTCSTLVDEKRWEAYGEMGPTEEKEGNKEQRVETKNGGTRHENTGNTSPPRV